VPKQYDATVKGMFEQSPEVWPVYAGLPPVPVRIIDADVSTMTAASDKVLRLLGEPPSLLDVNFQSGPDASLPGRVHLYNAALGQRHGLPVCSLVVLLAPKANLTAINGLYELTYPGRRSRTCASATG
jgi:hypothetical protein